MNSSLIPNGIKMIHHKHHVFVTIYQANIFTQNKIEFSLLF